MLDKVLRVLRLGSYIREQDNSPTETAFSVQAAVRASLLAESVLP